MTQLRACDACSRHVFANEKVCPFCNAVLSAAPERSLGQRLRRGMSRAQLLAVAAAVTGQTLGACTDTPQNDGRPGSSGSGAMDAGGDSGEGGAGGGGAGGAAGGGAGGTAGGGAGGAAGTVSGGAGGAAGTVSGGAGGMAGGGAGGVGGDQMNQPVYGSPVDAGDDAEAEDPGDMMAIPLYGGAPIPDPNP